MAFADHLRRIKSEIDEQETTLKELCSKWSVESFLKRLSDRDQTKVFKAAVSGKTLITASIPKLKFKLDLSLTNGEMYENIINEWEGVKLKIQKTLKMFENLEKEDQNSKSTVDSKKLADYKLSRTIERSLRRKKAFSPDCNPDNKSATKLTFSDDEMELESISSKNKCINEAKSVKKFLSGSLANATHQQTTKTNSDVAGIQDALKNLVASRSSRAAHRQIHTLDSSFEPREMMGKAEEDVLSSFKQKERNDKKRSEPIGTTAGVNDENESRWRARTPMPLPIDSVLDLVDALPSQIRKSLTGLTSSLEHFKRHQAFSKKEPLSDRSGSMVSMDKLRPEYRDDRFDASEYFVKVPDSHVEDHLKRFKELEIDNAVGRFFGSFDGNGRDKDSDDMKVETTPKMSPPSDELLGRYHTKRVNLLKMEDK